MNVRLAEILKKLVTDPVALKGRARAEKNPTPPPGFFTAINLHTFCMPGIYSELLVWESEVLPMSLGMSRPFATSTM